MRQTKILIVSFIIFVIAFLGYSLWRSRAAAPLTNEQQEKDLQLAEKYLQNAEPERSLPIIHKHQKEMQNYTSEGKKWLKLFVDASTALNDTDQLILIFQFRPDIFKENEKGALNLAETFLREGNQNEYIQIRELWRNHEKDSAAWVLLDADDLIQNGEDQRAYDLLKSKKWTGKSEEERLIRIAMIKFWQNPQEALDILNDQYSKDPKQEDILLYRGKIYELLNKQPLAEQDFLAAVKMDPHNVHLQDQLAEFYRRGKNYFKALSVWKKVLDQSSNDFIWLKSLFWNRVAFPIGFQWKNSLDQNHKSHPFLNYVLNLKAGTYWDEDAFENNPQNLHALSEYQGAYWLRLLQALKDRREHDALALLENNPFEMNSWAPLMELSLRRILNFRKHGSLSIEGEVPHAEPLLDSLAHPDDIPTLYKELEYFAQQQAISGTSFNLPESMQALLSNQEAYVAALLSEGWNEAGLQLQTTNLLSADFPDWFQRLYVNALRQNRGNSTALKFIEQQKQTPIMTLLKQETLARIALAEGKSDVASQIYQKILNDSTEAKSFLARQAYQQKNWPLAHKLTEDLLKEFPGNVQLQENLKKILSQENLQKQN